MKSKFDCPVKGRGEYEVYLRLFYPRFMRRLGLLWLLPCLLAAGQAPSSSGARDSTADRMSLAKMHFEKGDLADARSEAETLHAADPENLQAALLLAKCYIKMDRAAEAIGVLRPLETKHPSDMELEYSLAFAEIQSGSGSDGLPRMERVARDSNSANAWMIAGAARFERSEFAQAQADLDAAISLNPSLPGLSTMAGQVRYALGDADAALPFFESALRANPRDYSANLYTGMYRLNLGDYDTARPLLALALQLEPGSPMARLKLAELNSMTGKYNEAVSELEKLERANPGWAEPHVQLAALYYKLHRPEDGQRERDIVEKIQAKQQRDFSAPKQ